MNQEVITFILLVVFAETSLPDSVRSRREPICENENGYQCRNATDICIRKDRDCDGTVHCPLWDDELDCDIRRCPLGCFCMYQGSIDYFDVNCFNGWGEDTLRDIPAITTYAEFVSGRSAIEFRKKTFLSFHMNLKELKVFNSNITLTANTFGHFSSLEHLTLQTCEIKDIDGGVFRGLTNLRTLNLDDNWINHLGNNTFKGIGNTFTALQLFYNGLQSIESGAFAGVTSLESIDLRYNGLKRVDLNPLGHLSNLRILQLSSNVLTSITPKLMRNFPKLILMEVSDNCLVGMFWNTFQHQTELKRLVLVNNCLSRFEYGTFHSLVSLFELNLTNNYIADLQPGLFEGMTLLRKLSLSRNKLTTIVNGTFRGLMMLEFLDISHNGLKVMESAVFVELLNLRYLDLRGNLLVDFDRNIWQSLLFLSYIGVDEDWMCCLTPANVSELSCDVGKSAERPAFFTCGRLLQNPTMRVFIWLQGVLAILGNVFVLVMRWRKREGNWVQSSLITSLSAADLMMGFYLILIALADAYLREEFFSRARIWRESNICALAGLLAILSSEASLFFIALISVDRFVGVVFPFSQHRLKKRSSCIAVTLLWSFALFLAVTATFLAKSYSNLYQASNVCIGLPFERAPAEVTFNREFFSSSGIQNELVQKSNSQPASIFSLVIFLGVNLFTVLIVLVCYICIGVNVRTTNKRSTRSPDRAEEIQMAIRMGLIVCTDFFCWTPIIVMGILSQAGLVKIPETMYALSVIFILPLNSCLNPYIYTMSPVIGKGIQRLKRKIRSHAKTTERDRPSQENILRSRDSRDNLADTRSRENLTDMPLSEINSPVKV